MITALHWLLGLLVSMVSLLAAGHALLYKRDPRAALGWVAACLMFPVAGAGAYLLFGINRVRTRARELSRRAPFTLVGIRREAGDFPATVPAPSADLEAAFRALARVADTVTQRPLLRGNEVQALHDGEQAYPAMLEAIARARSQAWLCTYIFDLDEAGNAFVEELAAARARGVDVRVIIDGFGEWYSLPRASSVLARRGVPVARFLRPRLLPPTLALNLRNHRKVLVVDGDLAFTGGMNISAKHYVRRGHRRSPVSDLHFRLHGPIAAQLAEVFLEDWAFCTGDQDTPALAGAPHGHDSPLHGAICRTVKDGPNEDFEKLATLLVGAIGCARRRVAIVTPYFLPSAEMISALATAVLRGVEVTVLLPERSNLPYVDWAARNSLWETVGRGVRVCYRPPPFVHAKLFLVDDYYAQVGSANFDPRSLRLNFELGVEVFDRDFSSAMWHHVRETLARSRRVSAAELAARPLAQRVRDALCWLASPYL